MNIISGCSHACLYCFAHGMMKRFHRLNGREWNQEELRVDPAQVKVRKIDGRVMYPSAHDITPSFNDEHVAIIGRMLNAGNKLLIVSKPHEVCIRRICEEFAKDKDRITFRFSIGSVNDEVLAFWEPGAPRFEERLACLRLAYAQNFNTSVSIEPMLEDDIDALIVAVSPFVSDTIWLGKINRLKSNLTLNGFTTAEIVARAEALIRSQNDEAINQLYNRHKTNPKIRFKESIKKVVGIELQSKSGMDL